MARFEAKVTINTPGLVALERALKMRLAPGSHPAVDAFYRQMGARYSTFARARFARLSRGGGEWPPLARSTIARRRFGGGLTVGGARRRESLRLRHQMRKLAAVRATATGTYRKQIKARIANSRKKLAKIEKAGAKAGILRDTGVLFNSLTIGHPGNDMRPYPGGVHFGFSKFPHGGGLTIQRLAGIHQTGAGRVPVRRIIVQPDAATKRGMATDAGKMLRTIIAAKGGG